jgi:hypothetical protein
MHLSDFDAYATFTLNGEDYIIIMELPMRKVLCVRHADVGGGADSVNLLLMEKPE